MLCRSDILEATKYTTMVSFRTDVKYLIIRIQTEIGNVNIYVSN